MKQISFLLLLLVLGSCLKKKQKNDTRKIIDIEYQNINSIYLKSELYGKDSIKLKQKEIINFIQICKTSNEIGVWKFKPEFWMNVSYNDTLKDFFKIKNNKIIKGMNDLTFKIIDTTDFFKNIWNSRKNILSNPKIKSNNNIKFKLKYSRNLFTGIITLTAKKDDRDGIYISKINENEIKYEYSRLVNWNDNTETNGIAEISEITDIELNDNRIEKAYKFIDTTNNLSVYVTISHHNSIIMQDGKRISSVMYNK